MIRLSFRVFVVSILAFASTPLIAALTITAVPIGPPTIVGGEEIQVEFFVTSDVDQLCTGGQIAVSCLLDNGTGTLTAVERSPELASANGIPPLCPGGIAATGAPSCYVARTSGIGEPPCLLPANIPHYFMTVTYEASPCVEGQFLSTAIDINNPPINDDLTRFKDNSQGLGLPIPIVANFGAILATDNQPGTCCVGNTCSSDSISEACCAQTFGGDFHAGKSCDDPDACVGPCCLANDNCVTMTADTCRAGGGTPLSSGTCTAKAACCVENGSCEFLDPICCTSLNGTPQPAGSQCQGVTSCCSEVGGCSNTVDAICCGSTGGTSIPAGTLCQLPEACCLAQTDCTMLDPQCCLYQGGTPRGLGSVCTSFLCCDSPLADAPPKYLFWADHSLETVFRLTLDGLLPTPIVMLAQTPGFHRPDAIVADLLSRKVYWTQTVPDRSIYRSNFDGTARQQVIGSIGQSSFGIALDSIQGKIYWADVTGVIRRINLDGTGLQTILTGAGHVNGLDIDRIAGKMYWTEGLANASGRIYRANLDGSSFETILTEINSNLNDPLGIAVHAGIGKLYWSEGWNSSVQKVIRRSNLDGSNIETIVGPLSSPVWDVTIDTASGKIYWTGPGIHRADLDGSNVEQLVPDQPFPYGIAILEGELLIDCQPNGFQDACELINGTTGDCNSNDLPDACDIAAGTSQDSNTDGIPDECCGDSYCTSFERCLCVEDCGIQPTQEYTAWCSDGIDNDCDGLTDCADPDCEGPCFRIPTVSTWGAVILALIILTAAKTMRSTRRFVVRD